MRQDKLAIDTFRGSAMDCGVAYGQAFEPQIMGFCRMELEPDRKRLSYARRCWQHVEKDAPASARFMKGMARGAHLSIEHVTLLALHEEIVHTKHCTAFAASRDDRTIVAMNWDWSTPKFPWAGLLKLKMTGSPRMVTYHYPGLWAGAGVNEHGVALMWTGSGYFPPIPPVVGLPTYVIIAEILRRKTVRHALSYVERIKQAGFGIQKTFEDFDHRFNAEALPGSTLRDLATCHLIDRHQNVVVGGPPGIGKTHVVKALGHEACRQGRQVLFRTTQKLLGELLADSAERAERVLRRAINVELLILDDFAFRKLDQREAESLYVLAEERLGRASTLLTSNRPPEDWYAIFPDPVVGGAILDRLVSSAIKIVTTTGKSYRREVMGSPLFRGGAAGGGESS